MAANLGYDCIILGTIPRTELPANSTKHHQIDSIVKLHCLRYLFVERQKDLPVVWRGKLLDLNYRTDLIVENKVIVEIKSVQEIHPVHPKQVLTYLKLSGLKLGLLINFNSPLIKTGITRIVNNL